MKSSQSNFNLWSRVSYLVRSYLITTVTKKYEWIWKFLLVFGQFSISSWWEKGHEPSQAELKILQLELWLEPARLGLITQTKPTQTSSDFIKRAHHRTFIERLWQQPKKLWARESCLLGKPLFLSRNVWVKLTDSPSRWHHLMIIKGLLWHSQPCLAAKWITFGVS